MTNHQRETKRPMTTKPYVTTLDYNEAFPTLPRDEHEFGVQMTHPEGGCVWEFMVAEIPNRSIGGPREPIGVQVRMFGDSWQAYADIPEFFDGLSVLSGQYSRVNLDHVKTLCHDLGYPDRTSEYASRHDHMFRCACGEYHPDELAKANR